MKSVAIIGASSFIGEQIIRSNKSYYFIPIVRRPSGIPGEIVVKSYDLIPQSVFEGVGAVINCIGVVSAENKETYFEVNKDLVFSVAKYLKSIGIQHFIHLSSLSVYGPVENVNEFSDENPITLYGKSKLAGDEALLALEDDNFVVSLVRLPIVYDQHLGGKIAKLVHFMARFRFFVCPIKSLARAVIHMTTLNYFLGIIVSEKVSGKILVCDAEDMNFEVIKSNVSRVTGKRIFLIKLPLVFFMPIKMLFPSLYNSLYRMQKIESTILIKEQQIKEKSGHSGLAILIKNVLS